MSNVAKGWPAEGAMMQWRDTYQCFHGCPQWTSQPGDSSPAFYVPDFFMNNSLCWLSFADFSEVTKKQLLATPVKIESAIGDWNWQSQSRQIFVEKFDKILNWIERGEINKMVPTTKLESKFSAERREHLLQHLFSSSPGLMSYGFWTDQQAMFGKTPEVLVERIGKDYCTMALAGTSRMEDQSPEEFLADRKERYEHQLVIDDIVQRLKSFGKVDVGDTHVLKIAPLMHLKTDISFRGPNWDLHEAVEVMHPTCALGVYPREKMTLLHTLDPQRGRFGAPFGLRFHRDKWKVLVAIRNIEVIDQTALLQAGCGIVEMSRVDREWQELKNKQDAVAKLFGLEL